MCYSKTITSAFCYVTATINSIIVITFLYEICKGIFNHLLRAGSNKEDLFGPVLTYFGTVETNSRGMLHLYYLVLLKRMFGFVDFRKRIVEEKSFQA